MKSHASRRLLPRMMSEWVYNFSFSELKEKIERLGMKPFVAKQIFQWLYLHNQPEIENWTNISKQNRSILSAHLNSQPIRPLELVKDQSGTVKVLIELSDSKIIEAVIIEEKSHFTFCISTQVGCPLACRFCATGSLGFQRNLNAGEILSQILLMKKEIGLHEGKNNLVFMGMGEPLLNYDNLKKALQIITSSEGMKISSRNITVSTAGILDKIECLENDFPNLKLSFSLNASDETQRRDLMPVSHQHPLNRTLAYFRTRKRKHRITFEYVLIEGVNDQPANARQMVSMLKGIPCKINIIPYNENDCVNYSTPTTATVLAFQNILLEKGFTVTVRYSKGTETNSACGQLVGSLSEGSRVK